ncbi:hypothetical protein C5167_049489 [Papaver somniferum]|uniref:Uncharacterized protein n=1 Tax=Papaver somniferum TaxID=3469 RepID=A0A4Y7KMD0_PAPSO|nr:hypothetical protein C5167_049489 [Papaver somniferum]
MQCIWDLKLLGTCFSLEQFYLLSSCYIMSVCILFYSFLPTCSFFSIELTCESAKERKQ